MWAVSGLRFDYRLRRHHFVTVTICLVVQRVTEERCLFSGRLREMGVHWSAPWLRNCRGSFPISSVVRMFRYRGLRSVLSAMVNGWRAQMLARGLERQYN